MLVKFLDGPWDGLKARLGSRVAFGDAVSIPTAFDNGLVAEAVYLITATAGSRAAARWNGYAELDVEGDAVAFTVEEPFE